MQIKTTMRYHHQMLGKVWFWVPSTPLPDHTLWTVGDRDMWPYNRHPPFSQTQARGPWLISSSLNVHMIVETFVFPGNLLALPGGGWVSWRLVQNKCFLNQWVSGLLLFSHSVVSDSLWPHGLQHTRLPCPLPSPGACSNSCPSSWWCHPTVSSSVIPFSSCLQSFPASGAFLVSQLFVSADQSIGGEELVMMVLFTKQK